MYWIAAIVVLLGIGGDPAQRAGRCPDGRVWTSSPLEQAQMLGALNQTRAASARLPLLRQDSMDRMAMAHAVDMACRDYFDHRNPERERLQDRLSRVNHGSTPSWRRLAEVIGTSESAPRQVARWLESRSHRRAVLDDDFDGVGIGVVRLAGGSRYTTYWAVELLASR